MAPRRRSTSDDNEDTRQTRQEQQQSTEKKEDENIKKWREDPGTNVFRDFLGIEEDLFGDR